MGVSQFISFCCVTRQHTDIVFPPILLHSSLLCCLSCTLCCLCVVCFVVCFVTSDNQFGGEGAKHIGTGISGLTRLTTVHLSSGSFTIRLVRCVTRQHTQIVFSPICCLGCCVFNFSCLVRILPRPSLSMCTDNDIDPSTKETLHSSLSHINGLLL